MFDARDVVAVDAVTVVVAANVGCWCAWCWRHLLLVALAADSVGTKDACRW